MSKETGVILIGLWIFILPFLGIPGSWKTVLFSLTGLGLAVLGFYVRSDAMSRDTRSPQGPFRDSAHESVGEEVR